MVMVKGAVTDIYPLGSVTRGGRGNPPDQALFWYRRRGDLLEVNPGWRPPASVPALPVTGTTL